MNPIDTKLVQIVPTKGAVGRGGGLGGESWRIEANGKRAGVIFINIIDKPPIGQHASIQIFLNIANRNKGIGTIAYKLACKNSKYDIIYAHMRKSNTASKRAAEKAGFKEITFPNYKQLIMIWQREKKYKKNPTDGRKYKPVGGLAKRLPGYYRTIIVSRYKTFKVWIGLRKPGPFKAGGKFYYIDKKGKYKSAITKEEVKKDIMNKEIFKKLYGHLL
jgi:hypothetical protein